MSVQTRGLKKESIIIVRYANGTYTARWQGRVASCTSSPELAAERVAVKVLGGEKPTLLLLAQDKFVLGTGLYGYKAKVAA